MYAPEVTKARTSILPSAISSSITAKMHLAIKDQQSLYLVCICTWEVTAVKSVCYSVPMLFSSIVKRVFQEVIYICSLEMCSFK